jgi:hypothetical protein
MRGGFGGLLVFALAACGNGAPEGPRAITTFEQAAVETIRGIREFREILDGVEDTASAEAARPRLEALAKRLRAVVAAVDRMPEGQPGPEVSARVGEAEAGLSVSTTAYTAHVLENPEIGEVLAEAYGDVQSRVLTLCEMLGG